MKHTNKKRRSFHAKRTIHSNFPRKRRKRHVMHKASGKKRCVLNQTWRQKKRAHNQKVISFSRSLEQGAQGLTGSRGEQGEASIPGVQGVVGPRGEPGEQGVPGAQGPMGSQGTPGNPGAQGAVGPRGEPGEQGVPGAQGPTGPQGTPGSPGAQGAVGPQGEPGEQGVPGAQGPTGPPGEQGPPGSVPGIQIIPTADRYFYFPDNDLNLSNGVTIPVGEFVDDEGVSVSEFAGIGITSYYNLYINGIVQPANSYVLTADNLFIPPQNGVLFAETPIIVEIIQLTAIILN